LRRQTRTVFPQVFFLSQLAFLHGRSFPSPPMLIVRFGGRCLIRRRCLSSLFPGEKSPWRPSPLLFLFRSCDLSIRVFFSPPFLRTRPGGRGRHPSPLGPCVRFCSFHTPNFGGPAFRSVLRTFAAASKPSPIAKPPSPPVPAEVCWDLGLHRVRPESSPVGLRCLCKPAPPTLFF